MKLIFMGTPDFSVGTLEALIAAGHEITLVVSQPDKPKGRGHELAPTPVKETALKHGLKVFHSPCDDARQIVEGSIHYEKIHFRAPFYERPTSSRHIIPFRH